MPPAAGRAESIDELTDDRAGYLAIALHARFEDVLKRPYLQVHRAACPSTINARKPCACTPLALRLGARA